MTSFLGAPILLRNRNFGNLYLTDKHGGAAFTAEDERVIQMLAAHAAVAIDNAQLHEQTHETLAQRLRELHPANAQLQRLTSLVITAQEEERRRIARELHDDTAQALTSVLVRMRLLARNVVRDDVRDGLHELMALTTEALDGVRRMALDLRPSTLDDLGLAPAVESYAREFGERQGITIQTQVHGLSGRLPRDRELIVYRVVQEALTNIAKHSGATAVEIALRRKGEHLIATIHDNGRGFAVAETLAVPDRGLGLFGMRERTQLVGGYLDVRSTPGAGITITLVAPLGSGDSRPQQ